MDGGGDHQGIGGPDIATEICQSGNLQNVTVAVDHIVAPGVSYTRSPGGEGVAPVFAFEREVALSHGKVLATALVS